MTDEQLQAKIAVDSLDNSTDQLKGASKLLKVLASPDALMLFSLATVGIEADTIAYSKIGLTRKRYYTRLKLLKNAGLIQKKGRLYYQTTMGSFLHENCVNPVIHASMKRKQMGMIDVLKRAGNFSEEDLQQIKNTVCIIPPRVK